MARTREQISLNMSRVRSSGSMIEVVLGKALWHAGFRYRKQYREVTGRPDFALVGPKIAIFCDSSFWHGRGWPDAAAAIKTNREFWIAKIEYNVSRDREVDRQLASIGWTVIRFWDDEILKHTASCVDRVKALLWERRETEPDDKVCSG